MKVAKNRLAKIALEGTDVASIGPLLKGPTLIAYSGDPIAAPKVATDFAKATREVRDPRRSDGQDRAGPERRQGARLAAVARRAARQDRRPLVAPATKIAQLVNAPAAKVARVVQAYASKGEAA